MQRREERVAGRWRGAHLEGIEDLLKREPFVKSTGHAEAGLCKGPEAGARLEGWRHSQEAAVAEAERVRGEVRGQWGRRGARGLLRFPGDPLSDLLLRPPPWFTPRTAPPIPWYPGL